MSQNVIDFEIAHRIANENQLLAEEQWLVEALKNVQTQRNSLQIERLHLESLKSRLLCSKTSETNEIPEELPTVNLMQQIPSNMKVDFDGPVTKDDEVCNEEELNLSVRNHALQAERDMEMEEYEDDTEDDDFTIDMNMFMNGVHNTKMDK